MKNKWFLGAVAGALILISSDALGESLLADEMIPVLMPFDSGVIAGAYGSVWHSDLSVFNEGESAELFPGKCEVMGEDVPCGITATAYGRTTTWLDLQPGVVPAMLYIPASRSTDLHFTLRVRESGGPQIEVPVYRETDLCVGRTLLSSVPLSSGSRRTLRLFSYPARGGEFRFTLLDPESAEPLVRSSIVVSFPTDQIQPSVRPGSWDLSAFLEELMRKLRDKEWSTVHVVVERLNQSTVPFVVMLTVTDSFSQGFFFVSNSCDSR